MSRKIKIIEAASENGAGKRGASLGPKAVLLESRQQHESFIERLPWEEVAELNDEIAEEDVTPSARNIVNLLVSLGNVSNAVENALRQQYFPLILSGDHSNAIGSVSGVKNYFKDEKIGIIWVDAHLDLHSPYTTPSGNMHGMAVNALLDKDNQANQRNIPDELSLKLWNKIKRLGSHGICPKITPENVVFIGIRDFESEEMALVKTEGIRAITPEEMRREGMKKTLENTMDYLSSCNKIYVSFDVDSQDTSISIGTGTPVPGGLLMPESHEVFQYFFAHPKVVAFEITEINPLLDKENNMAKSVVELLRGVIQ